MTRGIVVPPEGLTGLPGLKAVTGTAKWQAVATLLLSRFQQLSLSKCSALIMQVQNYN